MFVFIKIGIGLKYLCKLPEVNNASSYIELSGIALSILKKKEISKAETIDEFLFGIRIILVKREIRRKKTEDYDPQKIKLAFERMEELRFKAL